MLPFPMLSSDLHTWAMAYACPATMDVKMKHFMMVMVILVCRCTGSDSSHLALTHTSDSHFQ